MTLKKKTQEILYGYLFALPVIVGVLVFTVSPMITTFYYSFTSYNPLEVKKDSIAINVQEELEIQLGILPETARDPAAFAAAFDAVDFIGNGLGFGLDERQEGIIRTEFDTAGLASDLASGKLDRIQDGVVFITSYLGSRAKDVFPAYRPKFVGLRNFIRMFTGDQYFWITLKNTFFFAIFVVVIQTFLSVVLAVGANARGRGVKIFKLIYFIPSITSSSAISMIFWMIYSKPGVLNQTLGAIGIPPVDWLNDPATALPAVMALNIWTTAGYFMITFLAGLQSIPVELYEAAEIDGASKRQVFGKITVPMLRPQILYVMIMGTIGCMQVFDQIYYLTGSNMRNATIAFYIYKNAFFFGEMGYASAIALVLFAIIFAITVIQRRFVKESW